MAVKALLFRLEGLSSSLISTSDWLKDDYKVIAKMNLIDNFGYKEIADALDIPINTVKTKIRRAKAQLLKMMDYSDELL